MDVAAVAVLEVVVMLLELLEAPERDPEQVDLPPGAISEVVDSVDRIAIATTPHQARVEPPLPGTLATSATLEIGSTEMEIQQADSIRRERILFVTRANGNVMETASAVI